MKNKAVLIVAAVVIAAAGVGGGFLLAGTLAQGRAGGPGGLFAQLSSSERQQLQSMTAEERQAFFEEKGIDMPGGAPGADVSGGRPAGMRGGGLVEGTVSSVDAEKFKLTLSSGGSATVYVDDSTVIAAVAGATPTVAQGSKVMVSAVPEADGVNAATAIIVR